MKLAKVLRKFVFYIRQKEIYSENQEGRPRNHGLNRKVKSVNERSNDKDTTVVCIFEFAGTNICGVRQET